VEAVRLVIEMHVPSLHIVHKTQYRQLYVTLSYMHVVSATFQFDVSELKRQHEGKALALTFLLRKSNLNVV